MRSSTTAVLIAASAVLGFAAGASAQSAAETAKQFAPSGKLRVGVLMLSYFAVEQDGQLKGWSPDLGVELARRLRVPWPRASRRRRSSAWARKPTAS
jgi:ABC-type amino acid transport substrate-binding protein